MTDEHLRLANNLAPGVFDRQLGQLIMLSQFSVWCRIKTPTDTHNDTRSQQLLERLTRHTKLDEFIRANQVLCPEKFKCCV